jgi:taurine dioxygenase
MSPGPFEIRPMTGLVGAGIHGIDLAHVETDDTWETLSATLTKHGVIFFRAQNLTPADQIAFASRLGNIVPTANLQKAEGQNLIDEVRKEPADTRALGDTWHTDQSFQAKPPRYTILYARELPPFGGDTLFISMAAAYEALSNGMKQTLAGLRAIHLDSSPYGGTRNNEAVAGLKRSTHPVVVRLPDTGRQALYVNPDKTVRFEGWTKEESEGLLGYLYEHAQKPEFGCRFMWQQGSMGVWDNYQTWHYAVNDYPGNRRVMHRITVGSTMFS